MLPSSHPIPIDPAGVVSLNNPRLLADAFSEFISASALLEASYRELQQKVAHLGGELASGMPRSRAAWRKTIACVPRCSR